MSELFYQLGRCLAFRQIKHEHLPWITLILPAVMTLTVGAIFLALPVKPTLFGADGINGSIISLVATLPGFFIAALAAVSTFERDSLDQLMPPPTPKLNFRTRGQDAPVELTMRVFLSHLFSYLTTYSFLLALLCVIFEALVPSVRGAVGDYSGKIPELATIVRTFYVIMVAWLLSNIITATLFGMYFLAERMHRPIA